MKLIKAIEVTSRCRRRDGWWVGEGEMLRGLRELSCLDLQKNVFAFFFQSRAFERCFRRTTAASESEKEEKKKEAKAKQ